MFETPVYRAIVAYSNPSTGEITVRAPALTGLNSVLPISFVGRTAYNGVWPVPAIGSQIVVTADDAHLTNVFWVQVNPDAPTSLTGVNASITDLQTAVSGLQTATGNNESFTNAVRTMVAANTSATDRNTTSITTLNSNVSTITSDISTINSTISTVSTDVYRTTNMLQTIRAVSSTLEARTSELEDYVDAFYLGIYR